MGYGSTYNLIKSPVFYQFKNDGELVINLGNQGLDNNQFGLIVQQIVKSSSSQSIKNLYFNVTDNNISDLSPISQLNSSVLEELQVFQFFISNNKLTKLQNLSDFFENQSKLEKVHLDFSDNPIQDAEEFQGIYKSSKLKEVSIDLSGESKQLSDINFLYGISQLRILQKLTIKLNMCNYRTCITNIGVLWSFVILDKLQYFRFEIEHQVYIQDYSTLSFIQDSKQIREIYYNLKTSTKDLKCLSGLQYSSSLRKIEIDASQNQGIKGFEILGKIARHSKTVKLNLSNTQIDNLEFLSGFQEASNLEELDLNLSQNQRVSGGQQLTYLKDLDYLETLNMNLAYNAFVDGELFDSVSQLTQLKSLYINLQMNILVMDKNNDYLKNFKNLTKLEKLSLHFSNDNKLTSLQFIENLSETTNLKSLDLSVTNSYYVSDLSPIAYLNNLNKLEQLSVSFYKLENAWDLKPFNKLTDLDNLQDFYLNVKGTDVYGYDAQNLQDKAQKQYPDANIKIEYSN